MPTITAAMILMHLAAATKPSPISDQASARVDAVSLFTRIWLHEVPDHLRNRANSVEVRKQFDKLLSSMRKTGAILTDGKGNGMTYRLSVVG